MRKRCNGYLCIAEPINGGKRCAKHEKLAGEKFKVYSALYEESRKEWDQQYRQFYASSDWRHFRKPIMAARPICEMCNKAFSTTLHHVIAIKEDWTKRLEEANVQAVCTRCHSKHELSERNKGKRS